MNDLDTRIQQALRARAEQLTEQNLTPMLPPRRDDSRPGWRLPILAAAAVVLVAAGGTVAIRAATEDASRPPAPPASRPAPSSAAPSPSSAAPTPSSEAPSPSNAPNTSGKSKPPSSVNPTPYPTGMPPMPLWPPLDSNGHSQFTGTAQDTALAFTRQYLGFTEITLVTSSRFDVQGTAHIGVGYRNPAGQPVTAAVLHLVRYGPDTVWEVTGTDDSTLTLEQPVNGTAVDSPLTVGGHITGVDENIKVVVRSQTHGVVGSAPGIPAGGQHTPWHTTVSFPALSEYLTVVASTGGHVQAVERFAVEGIFH
jgi:hypothetical protein